MYTSRRGPIWIGFMAVVCACILGGSCTPPAEDPVTEDPINQNPGGSTGPSGSTGASGLFGDPAASTQRTFQGEVLVFGQGSVVADNPDPAGADPQFRVGADKCWIRSVFAVPADIDVLFHAVPENGWAFAFWGEDAATSAGAPSAIVSFNQNRKIAAVFLPPLMANYRATWSLPSTDVEFLFFNDTDAELRTKLAIGNAFQQREIIIQPFSWYRAVDNCPDHVFVGVPGGIRLYKDNKEIVNFRNGVDLAQGADYSCGETVLLLLYVADNQPKFCTSSIKMP